MGIVNSIKAKLRPTKEIRQAPTLNRVKMNDAAIRTAPTVKDGHIVHRREDVRKLCNTTYSFVANGTVRER